MRKVLFRARERFAGNQRGNVGILFAFSAIPLIGLIGGAVDVTRYNRHKTELLNALDSAAVALARRGAKNDADADGFVNDFIATMLPYGKASDGQAGPARDQMLHLGTFNATQIEGGWRVASEGAMDTAFMPVIGINEMPLDLESEVMRTGGKYEIALALDNTGSMDRHGRMEALQDAAENLVDDLYEKDGAEDRVKVSLVPFVTAVNVKSTTPGVYDEAWIDPVGGHQQTFGFNFSEPVNRLDLFTQMGATWKGCVEARANDVDDTPPESAPSKWVPYLWPDEPDSGYGNSYLKDSASGGNLARLRDIAKYQDPKKYGLRRGGKVSDTTKLGPNAACPRPIVELTSDQQRLQDEIGLMKPHNLFMSGEINHSGTNVAQGLLWGWRTLSPGQPFDQGAPYEDEQTTKVLVLLSDGRNEVVAERSETRSDYTSYGYLAAGRMGSKNDYRVAEKAVDATVTRVCQNIKAKGIRLYMILFQVDYESTQDIFRDCASKHPETGEPLYFYVPEPEQLASAFEKIGEDVGAVRIAR